MKKRNWRLMLRRVLNLVFSRIVVTGVLLLLQAFWLFALFYWLADYAKWFGGVGVAMSIIMCLALIRQDSTVPEFKISWMILFSVMPVQGGILYLLWGNKRPALGLRHRLERAEDAMAPARKDDPDAAAALQRQDPRAALTARYLHDYGPMPVCGGTAAKYYPDGQSMFADMLPALQGAQHSIYVESFIIGMGEMWGQIHEILRRKAAAGLDVRVIYDDAGCLSLLPHNYAEMMRADGIRAFSFNRCVPVLNLVMNNRDHRKIMVIDGQIAFTGGVNLADEYINKIVRFGYWKDSGVRLDGPGAASLANIFLTFWKAKYPRRGPGRGLRPARRRAGGNGLSGAALCRHPGGPRGRGEERVSGAYQPGAEAAVHLHAVPDSGQRPAVLPAAGGQARRRCAHLHARRAGQADDLPADAELFPAFAAGRR